MSKNSPSDAKHKPGSTPVNTQASDALLEKICELLDLETNNTEENQAVIDCLEEVKELISGLTDKPDGVHVRCVQTSVIKKAGYDVSDFDSGDLQIGDAAECTFSVTVDDPSPTVTIAPISGYTFTQTAVTGSTVEFSAGFTYNGASNPQQPLSAQVTLSTGETATLEGSDFALCSGAGESLELEFNGKEYVKELCFLSAPSVFQNAQGEVLDPEELTFCKDASLQDLLEQAQQSAECQEAIKSLLESVLGECEDACATSAIIGFCGRPANQAEYSYGGVTESTLEEFNASWEAAGGKTWIAAEDGVSGGECHWFCPAVPGSDFIINGKVAPNGNITVSPNPNAEALGCEPHPILKTLGCRDEEILAAIKNLQEALVPSPSIQIIPTDGCIDIDGDPDNAVPVTRVTTVTDGIPETAFVTGFGTEDEAPYVGDTSNFVDCDTLEPIPEEPVIPVCEDWEILNAYLPVGNAGVNVERWNGENATPSTGTASLPSEYFTAAPDYSGMPAHPNAFTSTVVEADLLVLDQVNDASQLRYWTYLYTTQPIRLRELHGRAEAVEYYLGECCSEPTLQATGEYPNTIPSGANFDVSLPAGVHYIGGLIHDHSAFSSVDYQYSIDGGQTWIRVPAAWLYTDKPQISRCPVKYCPESQIFADAVTGEQLGAEVSLCQPTLCSPIAVLSADGPQCELINLYQVNKIQGSLENKWTTSAVDTTTATGHTYLDAFTAVDAEGYPAHVNAPDVVNQVNQGEFTTNVLQTDEITDDQATSDFWLCLPRGVSLVEFNATADAVGVWAGECGSEQMTELLNAPYLNTGENPLGYFEPGIYRFRLYSHDVTANGLARLRIKNADGSLSNIPVDWVAQSRPEITTIFAWCCDDGTLWNKDKSEQLELSDNLLMEKPCGAGNCLSCG